MELDGYLDKYQMMLNEKTARFIKVINNKLHRNFIVAKKQFR